jgi:hypothetical protein
LGLVHQYHPPPQNLADPRGASPFPQQSGEYLGYVERLRSLDVTSGDTGGISVFGSNGMAKTTEVAVPDALKILTGRENDPPKMSELPKVGGQSVSFGSVVGGGLDDRMES